MITKVQQLIRETNFFTEKDFRKAIEIANNLEFQDFGIEENKSNCWFGLFLNESNAYWTIQISDKGNYNFYVEDERIGKVGKDLAEKLDSFIEDQLGSEERSIQSHKEYLAEQTELWSNYGYGIN